MGWINNIAAIVQFGSVIVIGITILVMSGDTLQSGDWVFGDYENETGKDEKSYIGAIGLVPILFSFSGFEASAHMVRLGLICWLTGSLVCRALPSRCRRESIASRGVDGPNGRFQCSISAPVQLNQDACCDCDIRCCGHRLKRRTVPERALLTASSTHVWRRACVASSSSCAFCSQRHRLFWRPTTTPSPPDSPPWTCSSPRVVKPAGQGWRSWSLPIYGSQALVVSQ